MMEDEKNRATQSSIEIKKEKEERMKGFWEVFRMFFPIKLPNLAKIEGSLEMKS